MNNKELVELHAHLGTSINPAILWSIAHSQGIKLPTKNYWEFLDLIILSSSKRRSLKEYLDEVYHPILDKISSGTFAVENAVYNTFGGAYRTNLISIMELRTNPMKHNMEGERDLDHVIMAMIHGMEKAILEYPQIQVGIIFCLDRQFSIEKNTIILEKAIKYKNRGIIGIDFSNYNKNGFSFKDYQSVFNRARQNNLGITVHSGENKNTNDLWDVLEYVNPQRIGHGILAAYDKSLLKEISKRKIILEICPLSNIATKAVENTEELKFIIRTFIENEILFAINTDWPEVIENAHLSSQFKFLMENGILNEKEADRCIEIAKNATFTKKGGLNAYL